MLVLTRKVGETVELDGGISVIVLEVAGSRVKLGFTAPPQVGIRRPDSRPRTSAPAAKKR